MALTSLFYLAVCLGCYKLGEFNGCNPGRSWEVAKASTAWLWQSLNK